MTDNNSRSVWWFGLSLWVLGSLVLASTVYAQSSALFLARRDFQVGTDPHSVTAGDFNGDGRLDLATANWRDNSVSILLRQGDGTFGAAQDFDAGSGPESVIAEDFNGDSRLDLVTANSSDGVSILLGQGD